MSDPYEVLGLPRHADEEATRRRYLELVRQFPPDRAPERFAEVRAAYDQVRDPARRLEAQIFGTSTADTIEAIAADLRARLRERLDRVPANVLLSLAETS
jgi:curved DNA-binding protein CbpA